MSKIELKKNWKNTIEIYVNGERTQLELHNQMRKYGYYKLYNGNTIKRFYTLKEAKDYIKRLFN